MVMTFDNMRHRYADGEIPKANLSKPAPVNWLKENAREDDVGPPGGTHVHIHPPVEDCTADEETQDRLSNVEHAIVRLVHDHYDIDAWGGAGGPDDATEGSQAGYRPVRHGPAESPPEHGDYQTGYAGEAFAKPSHDTLPSTPESINAANKAFWNTGERTLTGGSQSLPPNSNAASSGGYLPSQAGSINQERVLSTTSRTLDPGKAWGTSDAALKRGQIYNRQRLATNAQISSMQAKLDAFYKRGG